MHLQFIPPHSPYWSALIPAGSHDIYHLPGYLTLEAQRTHTLPEGVVISDDDAILFLPYLLRSDRDILPENALLAEVFDVVSPYGYPGLVLNQAARERPDFVAKALQTLKQGLRERGVCSAFFRLHPIGDAGLETALTAALTEEEYCFQGETVSVDLTLTESAIWNHTRRDHRNRINRAKRQGMTARIVPWQAALSTFVDIYVETMERVGAADHYLEFDTAYFTQLGNILGDRLHLCLVESEGEIASAGLYTEWAGIVQAIFGGTRTAFLKQSPSTLETHFVALWAKARGGQFLHLGGGVGATQDPLFRYKAGFSKQRHRFYTLRLITDIDQYQVLVQLRAKALDLTPETFYQTHYFPAYRAPIRA